jgi:hypothetical protein
MHATVRMPLDGPMMHMLDVSDLDGLVWMSINLQLRWILGGD